MIPDRTKEADQHWFVLLKPLYPDLMDALWRRYQIAKPERQAKILRRVKALAITVLDMHVGGEEKIYLHPPPAAVIGGGEYHLGSIVYPGKQPYAFTLYAQELLQHTFVLGPTGTGKTTFLDGFIGELLRNGIPWWSIDWKRDTRALLHHPQGKDILVLTVGTEIAPLRINMLRPPAGVTVYEWVEKISDVISEGYLLGPGARKMLKSGLLSAISVHGDETTLRDAVPYIRAEIGRAKARELNWLQSCERAIDELTTGPFGEALNARDAMTMDELLPLTVDFELEGLGIDQGRTFSIFLLQALLLMRKKQQLPKEVLRHMLIFDEAQNIFVKEKQGDPPSVQSQMIKEVRAYGQGVICLTQMLENFSNAVKTNSYTTIMLPTTDSWDVRVMSETLQVKPEWISSIPRGHAIVRLRYRWQKPFLISFPEQPIKNLLTTDEIVKARHDAWRKPKTSSPPAGLTPNERTFLMDIARYPVSTVTARYTRLRWNPNTGNIAQTSLLDKGLVEFNWVPDGRTRLKILTPTDTGTVIVQENGGIVRPTGPAGAAHELWRSRLRDRCEQHLYTVTEEYHLGDRKRVDLLAQRGNTRICIEVETGKSDVQANIDKCKGQTLVLFFTSKTVAAQHQIPRGVIVLTPENINEIHQLLN